MRMMTQTLLVPLTLVALGCGEREQANPQPAPPPQAPKPEPAAAKVHADRIEDPTFALNLASAGPYDKGKLGSFAVHLEPRGEYHINQDFPMTVTVKPHADLVFPKRELAKSDAAEFTEDKARFDVPFTPSRDGEHKVDCEVSFAVCTPENCVPETRTLALALPVK